MDQDHAGGRRKKDGKHGAAILVMLVPGTWSLDVDVFLWCFGIRDTDLQTQQNRREDL